VARCVKYEVEVEVKVEVEVEAEVEVEVEVEAEGMVRGLQRTPSCCVPFVPFASS
jgi:preprotein translocase subunit SecB